MSDDVRIGLIAGGAVAVLLAVLWRFLVLQGRRRRIRKGLEATDPQDRARAGVELADQGLQHSARTLLGFVAREADERVLHAIALAVARRQWEPVNSLRVRQLREWSARELAKHGDAVQAFGPAVTRLADMGGPRDPDAPRYAAAAAGTFDRTSAELVDEAEAAARADVPAPAVARDPAPDAEVDAAWAPPEIQDDVAPPAPPSDRPAVSWHPDAADRR